MGVIKIERLEVDKGNNTTATLSNTVDTTRAFVKHISSSDKGSGLVGNTGNLGPRDGHIGALITGSNEVTFYSGTSSNQKFMGEVWRYTGSGGASEFIVRDHMQITIPAGQIEATQSITGLIDRNKVIPFLTGVSSTSTDVNDYDAATVGVYVNSSGQVVARRGATNISITAYIEVVEFTGSNWSVGHGVSSAHDSSVETVTLNTDSTGSGGSTFDVGSWSNAIIEGTMGGDRNGETGLADVLATFYPTANTTQIFVDIFADGGARNDNSAYIHVLVNSAMITQRGSNINLSEGNNSFNTLNAPTTGQALEDVALEWFSDTSGVGTAHARGRLNAEISADGTIRHWVHRSGNNVNAYYGICDLSLIEDIIRPIIISINPINILSSQNVILNGTNFGATQGKIYISTSTNFADTKTEMTNIISWSDTSIEFFLNTVGFPEGFLYIFVEDSFTVNSGGRQIFYGEEPYNLKVLNLSPDHYWRLDGNYTDTAGSNNMSQRVATCTFVTQPITRNNTESLRIVGGGTRISDSGNINLNTETTRTFGGWIQLNEEQTALVNIYEEGGAINNVAFFIGLGGVLIAQLADTGDDNVHAYSDLKLVPGRPYHILWRFDYNGTDVFELLVDGVPQSVSFNNPLTSTNLDSHSGDVSWGLSESSLEVFGTDVEFVAPNDILYSDWASWRIFISNTDVFNELFVQGIRSNVILAQDTQANMQTALNAITSLDPDVASLTIPACTDGDFTLSADNLNFPSLSTYDIYYKGPDTLTWINLNGTNVDQSRILAPNGGNVIIVNPAVVTLSGVANNSKVTIYEAGTENVLFNTENSSGAIQQSVTVAAIDYIIINDNFNIIQVFNFTISGDTLIPIVQEADNVFDNP